MANFNEAYPITAKNEAGYNPGIGENETFAGIDRGMNPHWAGWITVDQVKKGKNVAQINQALKTNKDFMSMVVNFFYLNYWQPLNLSKINDQQVANILYDGSVNPCEISIAKVMQIACNDCHVSTDLVVDGRIGDKTIAAINSIDPETYYNAIIAIRTFHYNDEVIKHATQRQWLKDWLSRLIPYVKNKL